MFTTPTSFSVAFVDDNMKSRLANSLFVGEWRRSISLESIWLLSEFTSFNVKCPLVSRFCCQGLQSEVRTVYTSSSEDDFSELGPPVAGNSAVQLKLVTEKPEHFVKTESAGKASGSRSFPLDCRPSMKNIFQNLDKCSPASNFTLHDQNDASMLAVKKKSSSKLDTVTTVNQKSSEKTNISCSISVENIPSTIGLSDLVQAISVFGKVSSACIRSVPDGLDCCDIQFENSESSRRAVLAGVITVESFHLPIHPLHSLEIVSIRILGIGKGTTDLTIHSICKSIGALEGLSKAGMDAVDALFRVKNKAESQSIVKRLNNTIIDDYCWSAYQLPRNSTSCRMLEKEDAKCKLGLEMNTRLVELKRQLDSKKVYFEDLQLLHMGILHLECLPTTSSPFHLD